jgi:hypothetical protein
MYNNTRVLSRDGSPRSVGYPPHLRMHRVRVAFGVIQQDEKYCKVEMEIAGAFTRRTQIGRRATLQLVERLWGTETRTEQGAKKGPLIWWASSDRTSSSLAVEVGVDEPFCVVVGHLRTPAGLSLALQQEELWVGRP